MKLGVMQPYFFPYIAYFQLIAAVNQGIIFDIAQYSKKSWMNRNRILHPNAGWQYVSVPVRASHGTPIYAAKMVDRGAALRRILGQLEHYRYKAPYYCNVIELVSDAFANCRGDGICELNVRSLEVVCNYLGIRFNWDICSELNLELPAVAHAGQWALAMSVAHGATQYINLPGGRSIFAPDEWQDLGIELLFLEPIPICYETSAYEYIENLSILDVMMWVGPSEILDHVHRTLKVSP